MIDQPTVNAAGYGAPTTLPPPPYTALYDMGYASGAIDFQLTRICVIVAGRNQNDYEYIVISPAGQVIQVPTAFPAPAPVPTPGPGPAGGWAFCVMVNIPSAKGVWKVEVRRKPGFLGTPTDAFLPPANTYSFVELYNHPVEGLLAIDLEGIEIYVPPTCPTGTIVKTNEGPCVNGKRKISFEATVTAPASTSAFGQWEFGYPPGGPSLGPAFIVPTGQTQSGANNSALKVDWDYAAPAQIVTYTVKLKLIGADPSCPDPALTFQVSPCTPSCEVKLKYSPDPLPCLKVGGSLKVDFEATLVPPNPSYTSPFVWEVKKGGVQVYKTTQPPPTVDSHKFSYTFTSIGSYEVTVTVNTPGCPDPVDTDTVHIEIKSCCPSRTTPSQEWQVIGNVTAPLGPNKFQTVDCDKSALTMSVTVDLGSLQPGAVTYEWDFDDGTTAGPTAGPAGATQAHTFTNPVPGQSKTYNVKVTVRAQGCDPLEVPLFITVPGCAQPPGGNGGTTPPGGGGMSLGCWILLIAALILGVVACILGIIAACTSNPYLGIAAGIIAFVALVLLVLWLIFCAPGNCGIFNWLRWIVLWILMIAPIVGIIVGIVTNPACGVIAAFILWGYWGIVLAILDIAGPKIGCPLTPPPWP